MWFIFHRIKDITYIAYIGFFHQFWMSSIRKQQPVDNKLTRLMYALLMASESIGAQTKQEPYYIYFPIIYFQGGTSI